MENDSCETCIFFSGCCETETCDDYYAASEEFEDKCCQDVIDRRRQEFLEDWFTYLAEYNDDYII